MDPRDSDTSLLVRTEIEKRNRHYTLRELIKNVVALPFLIVFPKGSRPREQTTAIQN